MQIMQIRVIPAEAGIHASKGRSTTNIDNNFMNIEKMPIPEAGSSNPRQEKADEKVLRIGDKEVHSGDKVLIERSDGTRENDWELKSFGGKFAVVEKVDAREGMVIRKVLPLEEFYGMQTPDQVSDRAVRVEHHAEIFTSEKQAKLAESLGIDMAGKNSDQISRELTAKLREISGV